MRFVFILLFLSSISLSACAQGSANVSIPKGQTFILGEYRQSGYKATLRNTGGQDVTAAVVNQVSGVAITTFALPSGERKSLTVANGQEVHLINAGNRKATIKVNSPVKGREGMRYIGADEAPKPTRIERPTFAAEPVTEPLAAAKTSIMTTRVTLRPGQRLIVGEGSTGDFNVTLFNQGASLDVAGRSQEDGRKTQGFGLGRFGKVEMYLRPNEVLHIVNNTGNRSTIRVETDRPVKGARVQ